MNRPIYLTFAIAALVVMGVIVFALRQYLPHSGIQLAPRKPPAVVLSMEGAYFVGLGHDGKQWSAQADRVEIGQNRSITNLTGIHDGKVFDNGKVALKIKAGNAVYDTFTRDLTLGGGVEIIGRRGQIITGAGADWNSTTQILRSKGPVGFRTKSSSVVTDALRVNLKDKQMEMWNVTMTFEASEIPRAFQEAGNNAR